MFGRLYKALSEQILLDVLKVPSIVKTQSNIATLCRHTHVGNIEDIQYVL